MWHLFDWVKFDLFGIIYFFYFHFRHTESNHWMTWGNFSFRICISIIRNDCYVLVSNATEENSTTTKNNVYTLNLMSLLQSIHRGPIYNIGLVWWMFQFTFISNTSKCAAHIVVSHHNRHSKTQWRKIWIDIFYLAANVEISIELTGTD